MDYMEQPQQHGPSLESQLATLSQFGEQLTRLGERDAATATDGFDVEFRALLALDQRVRSNPDEFYTALLGSHAAKNRYRDVLPNEGTRVVLRPLGAGGDGAYINANYIDGPRLFGTPCSYIATQAPLRHTVCDFWRMVVEHGTSFVVMLTAEVEAGKSKADRYWPAAVGDTISVGAGLRVTMLTESAHDETTFRVLRVQSADGSVTRDVLHMQHTRWPDMGVPRTTAGIAAMIGTIARSSYATRAPIVVHCSGGVGRTGVFITIHVAMALFQLGMPVSVPRIVQFLKYCRSGMVQRRDQYQFCYYGALREMERMVRSAHAVAVGRPVAAHDPAGFDPLQPPPHVRQQQQYEALQRQRGAYGHGPMPRLPQYNPLHPAAVTARSFNVLVPDVVAPPVAGSGYPPMQQAHHQPPPPPMQGGGAGGMALPLQQNHQHQQHQQPYGVIYTKQHPTGTSASGAGAGGAGTGYASGRAGSNRAVAFSDGTTPGSVFSGDGSAVDVTLPSVLVPSGDVDEALAAIRRENQRQRSSRRGPSIGLVGSP